MTFADIVKTQEGLDSLKRLKIKDYSKRFAVYKMYKAIMENLQFYAEQERQAAEECGGIIDGGSIKFNDDNAVKFMEKREALSKVPVEMPPAVILKKSDLEEDFSISIGDMFSLDGVIMFVEE